MFILEQLTVNSNHAITGNNNFIRETFSKRINELFRIRRLRREPKKSFADTLVVCLKLRQQLAPNAVTGELHIVVRVILPKILIDRTEIPKNVRSAHSK